MVGTLGFLAPELVLGGGAGDSDSDSVGEEASSEDSDFIDPFKTDAFSFGVTLEMMLLGEICADFTDDENQSDHALLLPRRLNESEKSELWKRACDDGHLHTEA